MCTACIRSQARGNLGEDPAHPAVADEASARATLSRASIAEHRPALLALIAAASAHGLPLLWDDEVLSIGAGASGASWPMTSLPEVAEVRWASLARVPVALVSGSNGKTTSVRLVAAMAEAQGWFCGHSCTDGLFFNGRGEQGGDYSGPAGARIVSTAWYDNSKANKANPDPTKDVWWGDQTWEEMMFTGLTYSVIPTPAPTAQQ